MSTALPIAPRFVPALDPAFVPAFLWNRAYRARVAETGGRPLAVALERSDGSVSVFHTAVLPHEGGAIAINHRYVERLLKFLLWQKGGWRVTIAGEPRIADHLRGVYSPTGARAFYYEFMGERIYGRPMRVESADYDAAPTERETAAPLGRHLDGCRIGFDLGASDRKCAAIAEGQVVFSEEVPWNPSKQTDPQYHFGGIPFEVVNDGEVTALAGSMALNDNAVLGIAMGSSLAAGYVTPQGAITSWLNELAFVPVDYRENAPLDEWSGDCGVGVQYFSQQAVGRLLEPAGIHL